MFYECIISIPIQSVVSRRESESISSLLHISCTSKFESTSSCIALEMVPRLIMCDAPWINMLEWSINGEVEKKGVEVWNKYPSRAS